MADGDGTEFADSSASGEVLRHDQAEKPPRSVLTKNERLVLDTLGDAEGPLKAYELLDQLKTQGVKAPMTVYRALDRLEGRGLVHKLDGLGAFVVCNHDAPHAMQTFLVCENCGSAAEVDEEGALGVDGIAAVADERAFKIASARLEIRGLCRECQ